MSEVTVEFSYGVVEPADNDPHKLFGHVEVCGERHYIHGFEVVDEEQNPHPDMLPEHQEWYHDLTVQTTPDSPRKVVQIPGLEGRWVLVVCP